MNNNFDIEKFAYAKLNLFLHIVGRKNGYHEINSINIRIRNLYDRIRILDTDDAITSVTFNGKFQSYINPNDNSIIGAINAMKKEFSIKKNFKIIVEKSIPVQAGLGGASADAASVVNAISDICNLHLTIEEKKEFIIKYKLGSDTIYCLEDCAMFVSGIGDVTSILENNFQKLIEFIIIIKPKGSISTKQAYLEYKLSNIQFSKSVNIKDINKNYLINIAKNDLQEIASYIAPETQTILNDIKSMEGCLFYRLSGSGSTCFGVFNNKTQLLNAYNSLIKKYNSDTVDLIIMGKAL